MKNGLTILRTVIFSLAVCLIVCGFLDGSAADVLAKAVRICMECIGLG